MSIDDNEVLIIGRIGRIEKTKQRLNIIQSNENQPVDDGFGFGFGSDDVNNKGGSKTKRKPIKYSNSKTRKDRKNHWMNGGVKDFDLNAFLEQVLDKYFGLDKETNKCEKHSMDSMDLLDSFKCENSKENLELKTIIPIIYKKTADRTLNDNTILIKYFKKIFEFTTPSSNQYLIAQMHHDINKNKLNGIIGIIKFKKNRQNQSIEINQIERYRVHNNTIHVINYKQLYDPFSNSVVEIIAYPEGSIMNLIQNIYVTSSPTLRNEYLNLFLNTIQDNKLKKKLYDLLKSKTVDKFQQKMRLVESTINKKLSEMTIHLTKLNEVIDSLDNETNLYKNNKNNIGDHLNIKSIVDFYNDEESSYNNLLKIKGERESISALNMLRYKIKNKIKIIDNLNDQRTSEISGFIIEFLIKEIKLLDAKHKASEKEALKNKKVADAKAVEAAKTVEKAVAADKVAKATIEKAKGTGKEKTLTPLNIQNQQRPPTVIPINRKK